MFVISFVTGGRKSWRELLTLPNILKEFNPNLRGYSVKDGPHYLSKSSFNVAIAATLDEDMIYQGKRLINRIREDPEIDLKKDWKVRLRENHSQFILSKFIF